MQFIPETEAIGNQLEIGSMASEHNSVMGHSPIRSSRPTRSRQKGRIEKWFLCCSNSVMDLEGRLLECIIHSCLKMVKLILSYQILLVVLLIYSASLKITFKNHFWSIIFDFWISVFTMLFSLYLQWPLSVSSSLCLSILLLLLSFCGPEGSLPMGSYI